MIKVSYIEDDHKLRTFISEFLDESPEFEFVGSYGSVEDFMGASKTMTEPDVLLQDISLPGMSGLEAVRHIKGIFPDLEVCMFTNHDDSERIFKALCAGASGYMLKNSSLPKIREGIHLVHRGEAAMSPSIARKVIQHFRPEKKKEEDLSQRERQIINAMMEGKSYKMIADQLMVSINTVRYHIKNIYRKLQVNSKMEIISKMNKGEI